MNNYDSIKEASRLHAFNGAAEQTIREAMAISSNRAGEYHDSWSLENLHTPWLSNLLRDHPRAPHGLDREHKRLIIMASMLDIKLSRLGGPWKKDTGIDSINYQAAYVQLREEFEKNAAIERCQAKSSEGPASEYTATQRPQKYMTMAEVNGRQTQALVR